MSKFHWLFAPMLVACATAGQATDTKLLLNATHTDFSANHGKRLVTTIESASDFGATSVSVSGSYGKRDFGNASSSAFRLSAVVHHDWNDRFFTRTSIAASTNKPVFATRELAEDLNFKPLPRTVLTVGGKYARYFDTREAISWSAGAAYYFKNGSATYRFSAYDVSRLGKSHGHLASFRLKDKNGVTQMWLGAGTALHDELLLPLNQKGKFRSVSLQRTQAISGPLAVNLTLGRSWYETSTGRYHGTSLMLGLVMNRLLKF